MKTKTKLAMCFYLSAIVMTLFNIYWSFVTGKMVLLIINPLLLAFWIYKCIRIIKEALTHDRVPCTYPMNEFYNFEDEVPDDTRVSTVDDCLGCNDMDCAKSDAKYCLIGEANGI